MAGRANDKAAGATQTTAVTIRRADLSRRTDRPEAPSTGVYGLRTPVSSPNQAM